MLIMMSIVSKFSSSLVARMATKNTPKLVSGCQESHISCIPMTSLYHWSWPICHALFLKLTNNDKHFCVSVYPAVEMRNTGPTIDVQKQPEGCITDHLFSIIPTTAGQQPLKRFVKIDNLPVPTTVTFELEEINMPAATVSSFGIITDVPLTRAVIYTATSDSSITNNLTKTVVRVIGNRTLEVSVEAMIPSLSVEHVRLKYRGKWRTLCPFLSVLVTMSASLISIILCRSIPKQ